MQQALNLIRTSLGNLYPKGEIEGFIRLIFDEICGFSTTDLLLKRDDKLSSDVMSQIESVVERLKSYEPIQYILENAYFGDLRIKVGPGVLIPRPETAAIVERIVADRTAVKGRVADLCTGSGCIAVALAKRWPEARVEGWDISEQALSYARINAERNNVDIEWVLGDVLDANIDRPHKYDVIVSNPPYILDSERESMEQNVLQYEPHLALFVRDNTPLLFYTAIARLARRLLLPTGVLYFEINSRMGSECRKMLLAEGYKKVDVYQDFMGLDRMVRATLI